ncbi:MAG: hypothetical protein FWH18_00310 [Marinilabiliaceae bacterium]|nr:hypothetical protein [Marinilabiliaceae bacterium]
MTHKKSTYILVLRTEILLLVDLTTIIPYFSYYTSLIDDEITSINLIP